ncbi:MAG: Mov34/MPN/PAD-1 family protein, partial [Phycisphaerae bacterium]|nr:Mov34/MPN/PAD-1 family protein [Phycisphaerae bacterium]
MSTLEIPNEIYEQILDQARQEAPIESCGMLAGAEGKVSKLYRMTNADAAHDHFTLTPEEQFAVVKDIRAEGLAMLAIYHSHPATPARLSQEDIRLALDKKISHADLLAGLTEAYKAGWRQVKLYFMAGLGGEGPDDI